MREGKRKLTPISYIVLGLVELRGPSTPYDLKRAIDNSVGYFWSFSHAQFYGEPARLAAAGLMSEEREETGRRRRTFSITAEGRQALQEWLSEPAEHRRELRDLGMLKLFFAELASPEQVEDLRRSQQEAHQKMIGDLEALEEGYGSRTDLGYRPDTIRWGLAVEHSLAKFWKAVEISPAKRRRQRRTSRRKAASESDISDD